MVDQIFTGAERDERMNPDIEQVTVGRKKLKEIAIYPLSLADQLSMSEVVVSLVQSFLSMEQESSLDFVGAVLTSVQGNFKDILTSITDDDTDVDALLTDITNKQAQTIGEAIYRMNYEFLKKSVGPWIQRLRQSQRRVLSPAASEPIPSTTSVTTTEEGTETEV